MAGADGEVTEHGEVSNGGVPMTVDDGGIEMCYVFKNRVPIVDDVRATVVDDHDKFGSNRVLSEPVSMCLEVSSSDR